MSIVETRLGRCKDSRPGGSGVFGEGAMISPLIYRSNYFSRVEPPILEAL